MLCYNKEITLFWRCYNFGCLIIYVPNTTITKSSAKRNIACDTLSNLCLITSCVNQCTGINGPMRHPDFALAGGMPPMAGTGTATGTGGSQPNPSPLKSVDRVRSIFPETWLWSNATIGFVNIINKHNHGKVECLMLLASPIMYMFISAM